MENGMLHSITMMNVHVTCYFRMRLNRKTYIEKKRRIVHGEKGKCNTN